MINEVSVDMPHLVQLRRVLKDEKGASRQALRPKTSFNPAGDVPEEIF